MKNAAATIRMDRRPNRSAILPAKKAPMAQPNNIEATLKPVPALLELKLS